MIAAIVLRVLHYILTLGLFLRNFVYNIPNAYLSFYKKNNVSSIRNDAKLLKKLPMHLGFVIVENDYTFRDIANLIVWSVAMGISYISVYDINGDIKRNSFLLQKEIKRSKQETFASEDSKFEISLSLSESEEICNEEELSFKQAQVQLLAADDGRLNLVKTAQNYCQLVTTNQYQLEDIVPNNVDSHLQKLFKLPDPDLVILLGHINSLLGYMPWQVRLSEILNLPLIKGVNYKSYLSLIYTYGKTIQRFGT
uniref:ditrans,polycis-polyprenyl diphosphate synthase [(2E,6E)-farnesyldiphosphate specific] n=1 Tax=Testudinalia testudinalis TaxID=2126142 RepID=A0A2P1L4D1_TESTE|nr:dehydrodolichyl diphosphate synthase complex subunit NUS1 [Testudinalia testudinalis]